MPELPEVETIRQGLIEQVQGKTILGVKTFVTGTVKGIDVEDFTKKVAGAKIEAVERRGKILLFRLSTGFTILIHLKMSGQLITNRSGDAIEKWTRVIFDLRGGEELRFRDMRRFGYVKLLPTDEMIKHPGILDIGPEPLSVEFTLTAFRKMLKSRPRGKIKPLLMDQTFIAGIGNIYSDEILHYAKVRPTRVVISLTVNEIAKTYDGIGTILPSALKHRGSSVNLYVDIEGQRGGYVPHLQVYQREGRACYRSDGGRIKRIKLGGRSSYFCPVCQK